MDLQIAAEDRHERQIEPDGAMLRDLCRRRPEEVARLIRRIFLAFAVVADPPDHERAFGGERRRALLDHPTETGAVSRRLDGEAQHAAVKAAAIHLLGLELELSAHATVRV